MNLSKKVFAVILAVAIGLTAFCICAFLDIGGIGTALAGFGGPITVGLKNLGMAPLNWAVTDGWTVLIFYSVLLIGGLAFASIWWQYDIPYKITGATTAASPASNYDNTMSREPAEPERQPTVKT